MHWPRDRSHDQSPSTNQLCGPHRGFVSGTNKWTRVSTVKNTNLKPSFHRVDTTTVEWPTQKVTYVIRGSCSPPQESDPTKRATATFPTTNPTRRVPEQWTTMDGGLVGGLFVYQKWTLPKRSTFTQVSPTVPGVFFVCEDHVNLFRKGVSLPRFVSDKDFILYTRNMLSFTPRFTVLEENNDTPVQVPQSTPYADYSTWTDYFRKMFVYYE